MAESVLFIWMYSYIAYIVYCIYWDIAKFELLESKLRTCTSLFIDWNELCSACDIILSCLFRCAHSSTPHAPPSPQLLGSLSTRLLPWTHWTVFFTPVNQTLSSPRWYLQLEQVITAWRYVLISNNEFTFLSEQIISDIVKIAINPIFPVKRQQMCECCCILWT